MLLYHFTTFWCAGHENVPGKGTIWRDGIKPGTPPEAGRGSRRSSFDVMPHDCVWLTREEFPNGWYVDEGKPAVPEVRITVRLPTSDKRLVQYERWLLNNLSGERAEDLISTFDAQPCGGVWRLWYCYFGTIPRERIKGTYLAGGFDPDPVRQGAFIEKYRPQMEGGGR
jgi:hypothetical protein